MRDARGLRADVPRQQAASGRWRTSTESTQVYVTERAVARRLVRDGVGAVIVKQVLYPEAVERLHHERSILERLRTVTGVPHLLSAGDGDSLILEDLGGRPIADILRAAGRRSQVGWAAPVAPAEVLRLAVALADILAQVHGAGVVHRDLNPANILLDTSGSDAPSIAIVNFDLATTFAQVRPAFADARQILGRLPYLAPEQTGRTALGVDQRTDLYAMGATLYEMLTGQPPFDAADPLRLIGDILTAVPAPVCDVVEGVPRGLSRIVARLLEKQPDARYQSAVGLAHDLRAVVADPLAEHDLGIRDFPTVLAPPQRLLGRQRELAFLEQTLDRACRRTGAAGAQRILVSGPPGVGKSALIEQLRPLVAARGGWFVSGKADQFQQDTKASVFAQAMDVLGHHLLTQSDEELTSVRARLAETLGDNAGLVAGLVPSFQRLLGVEPEARGGGDPVATRARITQSAPASLAGVVSVDRPVVVVLDDLQWASARAMETIDALFADMSLSGLVIIGAYRPDEVDAAHPLTAMITRWERVGRAPWQLSLGNLPPAAIDELVGEMLRVPTVECAQLSALLIERTHGNPYDTIEFLNALRDDGVLSLGPSGWSWDEDVVRRHIGSGDVLSILAQRLNRLPEACRQTLQTMSCLGTEVELEALAAACASAVDGVLQRLVPALEDGLLVAIEEITSGQVQTPRVVRFRHDRVQQAAHDSISPVVRAEFKLQIARRLMGHGAETEACALYLDLVEVVTDPRERQELVPLFMRAAEAARRTVNPVLVERYLTCAASLYERLGDPTEDHAGLALDIAWQGALYELGRLSEADDVYGRIEAALADPVRLAPSACIQIWSMTNRGRLADSLELGITLLERLGLPRPVSALAENVRAGYDRTQEWIGTAMVQADVRRSEVSDPRLAAAARVLAAMCPPAYFSDHMLLGWLVTQAQQLWATHGPQAELVPVLGHSNATALGFRDDRRLDRRVVQHALAVGQVRRYEPMTARTHFLNTVVLAHWFEPLEQVLAEARVAREALIRNGDVQNGCYAYYSSVFALLDCAASLNVVEAEIDAAIALSTRLGNPTVLGSMFVCRQFVRALQGRTASTTTFSDDGYDERRHLDEMLVANPMGVVHFHVFAALRDLIFDQPAGLSAHAAILPGLLPGIAGTYPTAVADLVLGLHAARSIDIHDGDPQAQRDMLDGCSARLGQAAQDSGGNFGHLAALLEAERSRLNRDIPQALAAFDEALRDADQMVRPWHQAIAYESAAGFLFQLGARQAGVHFLAEARERYQSWGAVAKVQRLDRAHPELRKRGRVDPNAGAGLTSDTLDMMAILAASQAIGSQTDPYQLHSVLVEQLKMLTGAKTVHVAMPGESPDTWTLQAAAADEPPICVEDAGRAGVFPLSAFRYVHRMRDPLVIADAVHDARFSFDTFFSGMEHCSLLAVPIMSGAAVSAVLILTSQENRGAFNADAQAAVRLVAGQLAVSIDNARLYRSLEVKVEARTRDLEAATRKLEELSLTDSLTFTGNRRRFDRVLEAEWATRGAHSLTVIMIDIDHFKQYNDVRGHQAGDGCLRSVAQVLSTGLRERDLVCRYGGEEFAIIAPRLTASAARHVAEQVRRNVVRLCLSHPLGGTVTVSLGVATADPDTPGDAKALVAAADAALYRAKRAGRNRVEIAARQPSGPGQADRD